MRKVVIVGKGPSAKEAPYGNPEYEFWGFNNVYKIYEDKGSKFSRWYEIHNLTSTVKKKKEHMDWLADARIPVYMQEHYPEFPSSIKYPLLEVVETFDSDYFTCTQSYMIAHAVYEDVDELHFYGIRMLRDEYLAQRPSVEYWLGVAKGHGIELFFAKDCDLLQIPKLYGYEADNTLAVDIRTMYNEQKKLVIESLAKAMEHFNNLMNYDYEFFKEYQKSRGEKFKEDK